MKFVWLLLLLLIPLPIEAQDLLPELVRRIKPSAVAIDSRGRDERMDTRDSAASSAATPIPIVFRIAFLPLVFGTRPRGREASTSDFGRTLAGFSWLLPRQQNGAAGFQPATPFRCVSYR